ncbi:MAG: zinc ribbon domain-containing protein [Turicibacter sp.]|nr:zinc ribbon domain-containing protein [Turicibacter sp.]
MICKNCSEQLQVEAAFCNKCGTRVNDLPQIQHSQQLQQYREPPYIPSPIPTITRGGQINLPYEMNVQSSNVDFFLTNYADYFPREKFFGIRETMLQLSVEEMLILNHLMGILKKPQKIWWFSFWLGGLGVDRFMIGSVAFGLVKLVFGFFSFFFLFFFLVASFVWLIWLILWFVDLFLIKNATQEYNFKKLTETLAQFRIY